MVVVVGFVAVGANPCTIKLVSKCAIPIVIIPNPLLNDLILPLATTVLPSQHFLSDRLFLLLRGC